MTRTILFLAALLLSCTSAFSQSSYENLHGRSAKTATESSEMSVAAVELQALQLIDISLKCPLENENTDQGNFNIVNRFEGNRRDFRLTEEKRVVDHKHPNLVQLEETLSAQWASVKDVYVMNSKSWIRLNCRSTGCVSLSGRLTYRDDSGRDFSSKLDTMYIRTCDRKTANNVWTAILVLTKSNRPPISKSKADPGEE